MWAEFAWDLKDPSNSLKILKLVVIGVYASEWVPSIAARVLQREWLLEGSILE